MRELRTHLLQIAIAAVLVYAAIATFAFVGASIFAIDHVVGPAFASYAAQAQIAITAAWDWWYVQLNKIGDDHVELVGGIIGFGAVLYGTLLIAVLSVRHFTPIAVQAARKRMHRRDHSH